MDARLVFVLSVFTLGLWSHVITAMQIPSDDISDVISDDISEDRPKDVSTADLPSLYRLEQYLYDVKNKLDRARDLYNTGDQVRPEPETTYHVVPSAKRIKPSAFYIARGRRAQEMTSQDGDETLGQGEPDLLRLLDYYRALHAKRVSAGQYMPEKRQPPRGFHAVRGKRSSLHSPVYY